MVIEWNQPHVEREAAGAHDALDVLEGRRMPTALDPCDRRLRGASSLGECRLTESRTPPCLPNQMASVHGGQYSRRAVVFTIYRLYLPSHIRDDCSGRAGQLAAPRGDEDAKPGC